MKYYNYVSEMKQVEYVPEMKVEYVPEMKQLEILKNRHKNWMEEKIKCSNDHSKACICESETLLAAKNGHLKVIKWLYEYEYVVKKEYAKKYNFYRMTTNQDILHLAAQYGHLELVKWLHETRKGGDYSRAIRMAAENGHLDVLRWLYENSTERPMHVINMIQHAVYDGHVHILEFLNEKDPDGFKEDPIGSRTLTLDVAARGCEYMVVHWGNFVYENYVLDPQYSENLKCVKWLHYNRPEGCTTKAMDWAAEWGHLEVVKWLHHNRTEGCTTKAMNMAAQKGHLNVVKWLHYNRSENQGKNVINAAVKGGHLKVVKWLVKHRGEKCDNDVFERFKVNWACVLKDSSSRRKETLNWLCKNPNVVRKNLKRKTETLY